MNQECRQVFCLLCIGTFNISLGLHPISYVIYLHFWHKSLKKSAFCTHPPGTTVIWEVHTSAFMLWKMTPWLKHFCSEKKRHFKLPSMEKSDKSWLIKMLGSQTFHWWLYIIFIENTYFFSFTTKKWLIRVDKCCFNTKIWLDYLIIYIDFVQKNIVSSNLIGICSVD